MVSFTQSFESSLLLVFFLSLMFNCLKSCSVTLYFYFSNKQDCKIIKFFEENMEFLELKNEEKVYEMLQNKYLFQSKCDEY